MGSVGSSDLKWDYESALQHLHPAKRSGASAAVGRSLPDSRCGAGIPAEKMMQMFV